MRFLFFAPFCSDPLHLGNTLDQVSRAFIASGYLVPEFDGHKTTTLRGAAMKPAPASAPV
ncbi:hypothetical protein X743_17935 [Mesorhizobium sp. LNHC252B00]|nr:hypothetical protein X743_17935 [Mesorhizobium sp. LNHC252B00]